jgi:hypothetical protein
VWRTGTLQALPAYWGMRGMCQVVRGRTIIEARALDFREIEE